MSEFNEETQRAKGTAGFKGGPFFKNPVMTKMSIADGWPAETKKKLLASQSVEGGSTLDPWVYRRSGGKS